METDKLAIKHKVYILIRCMLVKIFLAVIVCAPFVGGYRNYA